MVATAKRGGARLGAMLFLVTGATALYHFGVAGEAGRAANAHNLLLWRAIRALRKRGVETLDLGGLDTIDNPGIARFKLGSGARVRSGCGTWC
jgi:lipid II:glycine glycyltransferase (peptidoglycan interpeptide bridge formation enzyme)